MNRPSLRARATGATTGGALYDDVAVETSARVIERYSTSFGMASRLLGPDVRVHVRNIYALVRVADEIVDGVARDAGLSPDEVAARLDAFETETDLAVSTGYSTNLVVHAFAITARTVGISRDLTGPFFASMRADCTRTAHTPESFQTYVYGSAEVIGLMCLRAFLHGHTVPDDQEARLINGARHLGAAFQKVNFLRDLSADFDGLGRSYFPGVELTSFGEDDKRRLLADIDEDLAISSATLRELPSSSRRAVALAQLLFGELTERIRQTPASALSHTRVRVPTPVKLRLAAGAAAGKLP
ncbi:phytoene/squalene synthase family protein [Mycetocola zhujimingii]|uniref:phytoene/squalene synthase family protein n=1 Tax=Mycetocola zhujimingii TaxID=2079792 RepID=UPI001F1D3C84|nr:phytoene/squalene synthase family protein [Mycetocola zhujimingii]